MPVESGGKAARKPRPPLWLWRGIMWGLIVATGVRALGPTRYIRMTTPGFWEREMPIRLQERYPNDPLFQGHVEGRDLLISNNTHWAAVIAVAWAIGVLMTLRLIWRRDFRLEGLAAFGLGIVLLVVGLVFSAQIRNI